jgi:uncharacterized protein (TIGR01777 family)
VRRLVRRAPRGPDEWRWDPAGHALDEAALAGAGAVVHLAGVGVGDRRWSDAHKRAVLRSRVDGTTTVAAAVAATPADTRPVLLSASAVGWYGDTGDDAVSEDAPSGDGFLADVVRQWEAATAPAVEAGARVVLLRTGIVLSPNGGALGKVLPLFRLGLGGRLGSGRQWMPWITLDDEVRAIRFLIGADLAGPVNLVGPHPVRNADYTRAVAAAVHRPAPAAAPAFALRAALGGFADEGVLVSQRVLPARLQQAGFSWRDDDLDAALRRILR